MIDDLGFTNENQKSAIADPKSQIKKGFMIADLGFRNENQRSKIADPKS